MKLRDIQDLKNKPLAEQEKILKEQRERLRTLKFDLVAGKVKNVSELRAVRKNIARLLTFVHQKSESK
ncbi:MAG: 50S ribosomal protein L29 [Candidatus Liptonbacteria bacterium]